MCSLFGQRSQSCSKHVVHLKEVDEDHQTAVRCGCFFFGVLSSAFLGCAYVHLLHRVLHAGATLLWFAANGRLIIDADRLSNA
jgi:hypothetical protein